MINQLLRISATQAASATSSSSASSKRVGKISQQIRAAQVLLDAFGASKTATTGNATRQGRILELHFTQDGATTSILTGAKILTFGFDRSRLTSPLGKEERSFHVFYQFLAGASHKEHTAFELLDDPSEYDLLASSGCYRIGPDHGTSAASDEIAFEDLKAAFNTLGFKSKHTEMIYKVLSATLLLGNVKFTSISDNAENKQESVAISPESSTIFTSICTLLGLQEEDLERALVNKTTYIRKEVVCALLSNQDAIKQRDSLMCGLYAILFSYIVESINHRLFPGDDVIKKMQRDEGGNSIVVLDIPGFQTKSPNGGSLGASGYGSEPNLKRNTLIQAFGEDGFDQFLIN